MLPDFKLQARFQCACISSYMLLFSWAIPMETFPMEELYLETFPMEDFAYWLASFLDAHVVDTSVPCRFDLLLQMSCWQLPPQHHRFLLLRAQRVAKWCERRRKARPNLPLFEVNGRFPRLWICCKSLEPHDASDARPNCIEMIAERLAIDLDYVEKRQLESLSVSAAAWKKSKRIQNMSLRQAMETKKSSADEKADGFWMILFT